LIPLDLDGVGHAPDPVPFGAGAYIDNFGTGGEVQQIAGFARCQFALVGALQRHAAFVGQIEDFG